MYKKLFFPYCSNPKLRVRGHTGISVVQWLKSNVLIFRLIFYFDPRVLRKTICFWRGVLNFHLFCTHASQNWKSRGGISWYVSQASTNILAWLAHIAAKRAHKVPDDLASEDELTEQTQRGIFPSVPRLKTHFLLYIVLQLKLHRRGGKLDRPCWVQLCLRSGSLQFPVFTPLFLCHDAFGTAVQG